MTDANIKVEIGGETFVGEPHYASTWECDHCGRTYRFIVTYVNETGVFECDVSGLLFGEELGAFWRGLAENGVVFFGGDGACDDCKGASNAPVQ